MSIICRACLQNVDNSQFFYIDTFDNSQISNTIPKDVLLLCVPEMDLYISEQPGVCGDCLTMFESFYNFKNKCLASEDRILSYLKKNKMNPQSKVNLDCVVYDISEHMLACPEIPEPGRSFHFDGNGEVDLIHLSTGAKPDLPKADDSQVLLLSCNDCSFVTMEKDKLFSHKCLSLNGNDKYKCPYCEYATGRRYRLSYHINAKHTKTVWYDCTQCDYKTTDNSSLKRHQKVIHLTNTSGTIYSCDSCEFKTISEVAFQRHKVAKHGPPTQICTVCNYQTRDKSNFRKHMYVHGDKPRKCTKCPYQCVSPYQLERHYKRSHV